ncbi:spore coat associated protein CotJA [[Clostridium] polysaccharolyticum]|uniref:Spore coat associated protein JA (CotJA) n=1 Tax=[Clostridium] polysaccharolyticum TaxID=29364 RepID=A0A1I0E6R1_9FIRM|nr:spore coat associated protein CotJA [[Clostridium] polysaccharolyticum]SET40848.1 Spore coat associated protein JA (CotJA) [[Clostridium] polysaccharolyticum]
MNNKPCGCNRNMGSKAGVARMPRCMAMKPACNSCKAGNWSDDKSDCTCNVMGTENKCNAVYTRNDDYACGMMAGERRCDCACSMQKERKCDSVCNMARERMCDAGCSTDWAKKYESSCSRNYDNAYMAHRKYRKCDKGCELTFGEEVDELPVGMAYVPYQEWDCNVSNACQGLYDGTIFPELVKPFVCTYCYEERSCR